MVTKREKKVCLPLKNIGQHALDLKKFETSVPRPVPQMGQMPGASLESVLQHTVIELSAATFILVKYVNRTCCHLVIPETME